MDLKQLEYFVRVAELGSFTRAAIELDVAQPALSRQVRQLEVELRQTLLVRNGRGAVPTEAGKLLLDHGRGILHQVERAREDLGRLRGGLAGRVALGMPNSVARVLTVPLTRAFREALPDWKYVMLAKQGSFPLAALRVVQVVDEPDSGSADVAGEIGRSVSTTVVGESLLTSAVTRLAK